MTDSGVDLCVLLSQLARPARVPARRELAEAAVGHSIVRDVRARHGIQTSSPANLFLATGNSVVATRFSYDYGWYPDDDALLEVDLPYVSLWYTLGDGTLARRRVDDGRRRPRTR